MTKTITLFITFLLCMNFSKAQTNGKIELRKRASGCLDIPEWIFRDPKQVDTTIKTDGIYLRKMLSENKNLKFLYENKERLVANSESVYLINTTSSNIIAFTVKSVSNDAFNTSSTKVYKINPGEEILIGCDVYIDNSYKPIKQTFQIVGEIKY